MYSSISEKEVVFGRQNNIIRLISISNAVFKPINEQIKLGISKKGKFALPVQSAQSLHNPYDHFKNRRLSTAVGSSQHADWQSLSLFVIKFHAHIIQRPAVFDSNCS